MYFCLFGLIIHEEHRILCQQLRNKCYTASLGSKGDWFITSDELQKLRGMRRSNLHLLQPQMRQNPSQTSWEGDQRSNISNLQVPGNHILPQAYLSGWTGTRCWACVYPRTNSAKLLGSCLGFSNECIACVTYARSFARIKCARYCYDLLLP